MRERDKTKIGENVKAEATIWKQFQREDPNDTEEQKERKKFLNSLLAEKKPYFFRYKYTALNKEYNEYMCKMDEDCQIRFYIPLQKLLSMTEQERTKEQNEFVDYYKHFLPVVDSDCVMNKICRNIESVDFSIRQKVKSSQNFDWRILVSENFSVNTRLYAQIADIVDTHLRGWKNKSNQKAKDGSFIEKNFTNKEKDKRDKEADYTALWMDLEKVCSNDSVLANHLVHLFYVDMTSYNKNVLWSIAGKYIFENVLEKTNSYYFPMKNPNGTLEFLHEKYSIERVVVDHNKQKEVEADD